ncbi:hypothetical protein [Brevibacterium linens]|uniref:hypothetical protein n=1 Tax=Brevibacterium linens TaxID=1703 RepID=UPI003F8BEF7C
MDEVNTELHHCGADKPNYNQRRRNDTNPHQCILCRAALQSRVINESNEPQDGDPNRSGTRETHEQQR